jgi:hypothetical protein
MGELSGSTPQNDDSFAVILDNPELVSGDAFVNEARGENTSVVEEIDEDTSRPTDFRFLDGEDDDVASYDRDGNLTTDEKGPSSYVETEELPDRIMVFYNGMTGSRVGRTLDFNGQSYAKFRDDTEYLVKGLYQAHPSWRDANGSEDRKELAKAGKAPRVVRAPILRYRVDEHEEGADLIDEDEVSAPRILIDMTHYQDTRGYEVHLFDQDEFEDEFGDLTTDVDDIERGRYGLESESEIEYGSVRYSVADDILEQAQYGMAWHDEWEEKPDGWSLEYTLEGDDTDFGDLTEEVVDEGDFEQQKQDFAVEAAKALPDGQTPDDAFPDGIAGLVDKKSDSFYQEPTDDDVADIEEAVYEQTEWLDTSDLN